MRCQPNTDKVSVSDKVRLSQGQFGNCAVKGDIYFGLAKNIPFFLIFFLSLGWKTFSSPFPLLPHVPFPLPLHQIFSLSMASEIIILLPHGLLNL
jgi:hypothetical protein